MKGSDFLGNGRKTVYNRICSETKLKLINPDNIDLMEDFLQYLNSVGKSAGTIEQYKSNLKVFFVWNLDFNGNKFFIDLKKREIAKFQNYGMTVWGWSNKRMRTVKATLSSFSNYISNVLDDEYEDFRPIVQKIESPSNTPVREKTVFTAEDLQNLLDELVRRKEYMMACGLSLAINSGKRKAEIPRFKVSYFDDKNLFCGGSLYATPEQILTKGNKMLDVYILARPFKPYLDLWLEQREKLGIKSKWLFPRYSPNGKWYNNEQVTISALNSWAKKFKEISGKDFYWHSIRHYYTTYLLEQNLPESLVQLMQGWASSDMVKVYDDRSGATQIEKFFGAEGIKQVKKASLEDL